MSKLQPLIQLFIILVSLNFLKVLKINSISKIKYKFVFVSFCFFFDFSSIRCKKINSDVAMQVYSKHFVPYLFIYNHKQKKE